VVLRSGEASTFSGGGIEIQALNMKKKVRTQVIHGHPWAVDLTSKITGVFPNSLMFFLVNENDEKVLIHCFD